MENQKQLKPLELEVMPEEYSLQYYHTPNSYNIFILGMQFWRR